MQNTEVFTVNRFKSLESIVPIILDITKGKSLVNLQITRKGLDATYTVVTEDPQVIEVEKIVEKIVQPPEPIPGKGNGTSRYRGVYWDKDASKWRAQLSYKGVRKLKRFSTELEAAEQYDEWAREVIAQGGKAYPNFEKVVK